MGRSTRKLPLTRQCRAGLPLSTKTGATGRSQIREAMELHFRTLRSQALLGYTMVIKHGNGKYPMNGGF